MTPWNEYGPSGKVGRRAGQIERVCRAVISLWGAYKGDNDGRRFQDISEEMWKELGSIRADTGLAIGVAGHTIEVRDGVTPLLKQEARGISDKVNMEGQCRSLMDASERKRWSLDALRGSLDGVTDPSSRQQMERLAFDIADAIDRHEARIRHCLPALRDSASYVMLVDPLVIGACTIDMVGRDPTDRCTSFAKLMKGRIQSDTLPFEGARRIGNLILSDMGRHGEHEGRIHLKQRIPDTIRSAMVGRPIEHLIENHPATGMGVKITSVSVNEDEITIRTTAEDQRSLVPVEAYH